LFVFIYDRRAVVKKMSSRATFLVLRIIVYSW